MSTYRKDYYERNRERIREANRRWRLANPDKVKENSKRCWGKLLTDPKRHKKRINYTREWGRLYGLWVRGKYIKVNKWKRPEDSCCELCGKFVESLHYHHWDDDHPELGIWVCGEHHLMIERYNEEMMTKYELIKAERITYGQGGRMK